MPDPEILVERSPNPRPMPKPLYGATRLVAGAIEAVRGLDGIWAVVIDFEESDDASS